MHLIIDGYSENQEILKDEDLLAKWLESYPARIGMTRISTPYVVRYMGPELHDWGISGFVFIAESHIGIHTFVERNYVNIDVFSCKDFDAQRAIEDFREGLQLVKLRSCLIDRDWPQPESVAVNPPGFTYHE
ncbi:MAG: S-adenosylmethionine decarboxylase [Dehalococcoidia bacterium]|nr:S-adenosylmethionine decarboxylase [Dehalococcoidia bacterium]